MTVVLQGEYGSCSSSSSSSIENTEIDNADDSSAANTVIYKPAKNQTSEEHSPNRSLNIDLNTNSACSTPFTTLTSRLEIHPKSDDHEALVSEIVLEVGIYYK